MAHAEAPAAAGTRPSVALSIISHQHGQMIADLVRQLAERAEPCLKRVIVTLNTPEPALAQQLHSLQQALSNPAPGHAGHGAFALEIIHNRRPKGFGSNHNAAFATLAALPDAAMPSHVCILNPDLRLLDAQPLAHLAAALADEGCGLAYPRLVGPDGQVQDNERSLVTPLSLLRRRLLGRVESRIDWVSGACMMLRTRDWLRLGGFDERFHMYCEDVDLSLRVRRDIGTLARARTTMAHQAQRASHRRLNHLFWHVHSLLRLWGRPSFRWALRHRANAFRSADSDQSS
ncbi:MAG: glycosyltransferase [Comamonadaceae bacterium]|nr:glycosyltransferase [Comamonadaceae bacterium]